jgi:hypothetical protein
MLNMTKKGLVSVFYNLKKIKNLNEMQILVGTVEKDGLLIKNVSFFLLDIKKN